MKVCKPFYSHHYTLSAFLRFQNKKSDSSDRIVPIKRIDSETTKPSSSIQRNKRKNTTNIFQRTNQILHTYNSIFKKSFDRPGDAETYFRQTLRNYDDFELVRTTTPKSENKLLRQAKSSDSVKKVVVSGRFI